jgi:non-ribosomal peptide synthetase component E (peptide arylation enzyme)
MPSSLDTSTVTTQLLRFWTRRAGFTQATWPLAPGTARYEFWVAGAIEACLLEHPSVREAAVVGIDDDDLGQRIAAFVVLQPGESHDSASLARFVAERLSPHKRPRDVHFLLELPRNAMGKVQKKLLAG